jgi:hypothetical protein
MAAKLFYLTKTSQGALLEYCKATMELGLNTWDFRTKLLEIDREYYRENITTKDQFQYNAAISGGDKRKIADIVVPIVEPQIETSLAYLTSVFLTGHPIFGCVSPPAQIKAAKTFEAMLEEHASHGSWVRELLMFFRDGLKYNIHAVETCWWQEKTYAPYTEVSSKGLTSEQRNIIWQGNRVKRLDMYNTIFDFRVHPAEIAKKGEFAGYIELMSRIALKEFLQSLPDRQNVTEAFNSSVGASNKFYVPEVNWNSLVSQRLSESMDWYRWATQGTMGSGGKDIHYKNIYEVITRYCRIVPQDFSMNIPNSGTVQIWKIITVNDQQVVFAEKQTNAHNLLPILFGQPIEDGLGYQTKSQAQRLIPIQDTASALWNARLAAKRRSISDRGIYNPLMIREADINNENPSAKIPCRSSAYGKDIKDAYYPIPFEDRESTSFVSDAREMQQFANFVSGQNQVQQGQFVKGNKTQDEFDASMQFASGRQQMMAQFIEAQVMVPLKEILKLNILQYSTPGTVYSTVDQRTYEVKPEELRAASIQFKISDGLLPSSKIISEGTIVAAFQLIASTPALQAGFSLPPLFTYMMQLKGFDVQPFEIQLPPGTPPAGTQTMPVKNADGSTSNQTVPAPVPPGLGQPAQKQNLQ